MMVAGSNPALDAKSLSRETVINAVNDASFYVGLTESSTRMSRNVTLYVGIIVNLFVVLGQGAR